MVHLILLTTLLAGGEGRTSHARCTVQPAVAPTRARASIFMAEAREPRPSGRGRSRAAGDLPWIMDAAASDFRPRAASLAAAAARRRGAALAPPPRLWSAPEVGRPARAAAVFEDGMFCIDVDLGKGAGSVQQKLAPLFTTSQLITVRGCARKTRARTPPRNGYSLPGLPGGEPAAGECASGSTPGDCPTTAARPPPAPHARAGQDAAAVQAPRGAVARRDPRAAGRERTLRGRRAARLLHLPGESAERPVAPAASGAPPARPTAAYPHRPCRGAAEALRLRT